MSKIYIQLATGQVFEGESFGAEGEVVGEIVFSTGMVGYLESLSDPSYYGQILVQTFPLIGNYGVIPSDFESGALHVSAYVVREVCDAPSNYRSEGKLDEYLKEKGVIGVSGVDTRALTEIIRSAGVMNARITRTKPTGAPDETMLNYRVKGAVAAVSCEKIEYFPAKGGGKQMTAADMGEGKYQVALYDFGAKMYIIHCLTDRGCDVTVYPATTPAAEILAANPDGIMLSNGPGDPKDNVEVIGALRELLGKKPMFGICLGHQLLALAAGADTIKLKYGHRGANQPVKDVRDGRVYVTSQNHGYAVDAATLPEGAQAVFVNVNDGTCEGVIYPDQRAFTVQYHPEACGGPLDSRYLFDRFIAMLEEERRNAL